MRKRNAVVSAPLGKGPEVEELNQPPQTVSKHVEIIKVGFPLEGGVSAELEKRFPGKAFQEKNFTTPHTHPVAAMERNLLEELVFSRISNSFVVDIGGSVTRHAKCKRNVHSCNPVLGPEDNNRNARWREASIPMKVDGKDLLHTFVVPQSNVSWCLHTVQECTCAIPDEYVSIHSLYYLNQREIMALVMKSRKKKLTAVVHTFDDLVGTLFTYGGKSEASYELLESGQISMRSQGNAGAYVHDSMLWLQSLYFEYDGCAMSWNIETRGDSKIVTFIECRTGLKGVQMAQQLSGALADPNYYGEVVVGQEGDSLIQCGFEIALIRESKFHSCGQFMFVTSGDKKVVIPKGIVDAVAFELLGRDRTADLYQECVNRTKKHLSSKKVKIPEAMRVRSAIYVSAMAFTRYVSQEAGVLDEVVRRHRGVFSTLRAALSFQTPGFGCCMGSKTEDPVARYNNTNGASSIRSTVAQGIVNTYARVNTTREIEPIRQGALMKSTFEGKERKARMHQIGLGFSDHIPVILENTVEHEVIAVANRVVKQTPTEKPNEWKSAVDWLKDSSLETVVKLREIGDITSKTFEEWNASFPKGRRTEHIRAKSAIERDGLQNIDFRRKSFVKTEKYNKGSLDGVQDMDPRLIQGVSHKANVALGPWISKFSEKLKAAWSVNDPVCYASGLTAEQIGAWLEASIDAMGGIDDVCFLECDFSKFDCTQGKGAYMFEKYVYEKICGIGRYPDAHKTFKAQAMTRGLCALGTSYSVRYGRKSGDPNTTCGNSLLNGAACARALEAMGLTFKVIVMGDDMLAVLNRTQVRNAKALGDGYTQAMLALGFVPKVKVNTNIAKVEFCSGLFWPVGTSKFVLGPKPGKLAPKMGFSTKRLSAGDIAGTYTGYKMNCSHVPFLRKLVGNPEIFDKPAVLNQYKINTSIQHEVCERTRMFFSDRYGVDYDFVEKSLCEISPDLACTDLLPHGLIDWCFEIDN